MERVKSLIAYVEQGKFLEAMTEFYDDNATMQENQQAARGCLPTLLEGERRVLAAFKAVRTEPVDYFLVDGDRVIIHWTFEFVGHDGLSFWQDELACQCWNDDKIVSERFYYDPGQRNVRVPARP
jgi:ketosteroid isomerase-like protein